jgi:hypothetical protein
MNQEDAKQQLAAQLQTRTALISSILRSGETALDAGEVNELSLNTPSNLAAGEAMLFVTDQRLILYRPRGSESWERSDVKGFRDKRAPRGVPQRSYFRELTVNLSDGETRTIIGGRMFIAAVTSALS